MSQDVFLVEIVAYDPDLSGTRTLRYGTSGHVTSPSETPANTVYDAVVKQALRITRTMFAPETTRGRSTVGVGDIELLNDDGALDGLLNYGFDGRAITVRRGTVGAAYPAGFPVLFEGTMAGVEARGDMLVVRVNDWQAATLVPLQTTKYTGGGLGTLEGTAETLGGKPKPICYGVAKNIVPPCVETAKLIYQVADKQVADIPAVYDRGVPLTTSIAAWTEKNFSTLWAGTGDAVWAVTYGNGLWVIAGENGRMASSPDGTNWTSRTSQFSADTIYGLAYGAGVYVAVGTAGKISSSANGTAWTARTGAGGTDVFRAVVYGAGLFVAVGHKGICYTSPDGTTWTSRTSSFSTHASSQIRGLYYAVGRFVASGSDQSGVTDKGQIAYSFDGITWTQVIDHGFTGNSSVQAVAYLPSLKRWIAAGVQGVSTAKLALSPDGIWWTQSAAPDWGAPQQIAYFNGVVVLVSADPYTEGRIFSSDDGVTWTQRGTNASNDTSWLAIATDETRFLAVGAVQSSNDGIGVLSDTYTTYGSQADLLDDDLAPAPGMFGVYLAAGGSYFRLGAPPAGLITADVTQGANAAARTTGQIWALVLDDRLGMTSGDWSASDVTALDTADNAVIGFWTDQEVQGADVLDRIAASIGAAWYLDASGVFRIKQFVAPSGSPVLSLTANDLKAPLVLKSKAGERVPQYSSVLRYARNHTPQQSDLAAAVSDARRAYLGKEWREVTDTDSAVQTKHLLALHVVEDSLLAEAADAQAEVDRRQALRGVTRQLFEVVVELDDDTDGLDLNAVIELTHERYGLSGGESFRIIGVDLDAAKRELVLDIWR